MEAMISAENLVKIYKTADSEVLALQGLDLAVMPGEFVAVIGNSGSGKSTLLNIIGGLDRPSAGSLFVDGRNMVKFTEREMVEYKKKTVGFVWQNHARNLVPYLNIYDNVMLPLRFGPRPDREYVLRLIRMVGLEEKMKKNVMHLSGGEQQRAAIAVALAAKPRILLADEPTGALDTRTANLIFDLFQQLNTELGITIVTVTHDMKLAHKVNRVVRIRDGKTSSEILRTVSYAEELASGAHGQKLHREYAVLDRAGRVQIPAEYLENLHLHTRNRVAVQMEKDRIILTRDNPGEGEDAT